MAENNDEITELYRVHRPTLYKHVIGQDLVIKQLRDFEKHRKWPHAMMLTGPSGVGKTTLARIIGNKLGCGVVDGVTANPDFQEINGASSRGIETIRDIEQRMGMSPFAGKCRIWYIDESHQLSKRAGGDAQTSLLKLLEDAPSHVYFILATTDPQDMLETIRTRCTILALKSLTDENIAEILRTVAARAKMTVSDALVERIVSQANGSGRMALVMLNQVCGLESEQDRLDAVVSMDIQRDAYELVKMLVWKKSTWQQVSDFLKQYNGDAESLRLLVMANARKKLLDGTEGDRKMGAVIIEEFEKPFYNCGPTLLAYACHKVMEIREGK